MQAPIVLGKVFLFLSGFTKVQNSQKLSPTYALMGVFSPGQSAQTWLRERVDCPVALSLRVGKRSGCFLQLSTRVETNRLGFYVNTQNLATRASETEHRLENVFSAYIRTVRMLGLHFVQKQHQRI